MRFRKSKRFIAALLSVCMLIAIMPAAFASNRFGNSANSSQNIYMEVVEGGNLFAQKTDDGDNIVIITDDAEHTISISIVYAKQSNRVYQWSIKDYPVEEFRPDDIEFWNDIICYAEDNMDQADKFDVTKIAVDENFPVPSSSANADLMEDLEDIVGYEYNNKYTYQLRRMDGHDYRLYESMNFSIKLSGFNITEAGMTAATVLSSILGILPTSLNLSLLSGVFGLVFNTLAAIVPEGKNNIYTCIALYNRYVTVDGGSYHYADAYKIRSFTGLEHAEPDSRGRAHIFPDTEELYYDLNQTEEFYNSGIFDAAYIEYNYK